MVVVFDRSRFNRAKLAYPLASIGASRLEAILRLRDLTTDDDIAVCNCRIALFGQLLSASRKHRESGLVLATVK